MALSAVDTNILIYAFQAGERRTRALEVLNEGPIASVQILNEYAHASHRKLGREWAMIEEDLNAVRIMLTRIESVTESDNREALRIVARYQLAFYDGVLIAVALRCGASTLYSQDMHHSLLIDGTLRIVDPFR